MQLKPIKNNKKTHIVMAGVVNNTCEQENTQESL